jgi:DNA-binding NarL/FixJ family response regulator
VDKIRVLLVDDHAEYRTGLRQMLTYSDQPIEVVGEAGHGAAAVELAVQLQPDVILMDIRLPGVDGLNATEQILTTNPRIRVLMLTSFEQDDTVFSALHSGAVGYLSKNASKAEILRAITGAASGEGLFGSALTRRVLKVFHDSPPTVPGLSALKLTEREIEVLTLMAQNWSNRQIAEQMQISEKTVRNYVSAILDKLDVSSRAEAIQRAHQLGLRP